MSCNDNLGFFIPKTLPPGLMGTKCHCFPTNKAFIIMGYSKRYTLYSGTTQNHATWSDGLCYCFLMDSSPHPFSATLLATLEAS